ncbi:MAG: outer membrane lipoprotein-sorting protein [Campylobacterota bacterium]|nr:outer membrane lipoprotein-sorting protein [Campylobacterota bacterium]
MKILMIYIALIGSLYGISYQELAQKSDDAQAGFEDAKSKMNMMLVNARGQKRERLMKIQVLEGKKGDKSLMEFLSPADVKGTKFLNYEHVKKDDDQWLYLPALKRVKRIASKNKSGAFMGSEFSYEDLSAFNVDKYSYPKGEVKEGELDGKKVYLGQSKPVSKYSGYTKLLTWVDAQTYLIQKIEYYDRKKELLKTAIFEDYKKISGVWRIGKITMSNIQNDKKTILVWSDEQVKIGLKAKDFHKRVLKK